MLSDAHDMTAGLNKFLDDIAAEEAAATGDIGGFHGKSPSRKFGRRS